ncbi:hypothetical protein UFOVP225_15 [uncultured Caudovirales phage]|uniref:Uncharacterized protein n=1 Tax=uncultured Caudovirales phage TaxID=2100421 RepID=A0A6J7WMP5_9CAUD|nr:hypothetical protein UFOVP113_28 [uncultured Caudovirales phage]CAB5219017.1 hypothetical protein UFOVP225_15 [uncultured Caudovirales phage]
MSFIFSEDEALKNILKGIIVSDEKNYNREVGVWFANPDIEQRAQSYPYITVELIDTVWANYRQASGLFVDNDAQGTVAPVDGILYTYELPVAWDLTYQITTYARHPRHDRAILAHLLNRVFPAKRGYLPVTNDLGTETGYRHLFLDEYTKRDTIEDGRRLYRNVFTLTVTSEGAALLPTTAPEVTDVLINTTTQDIPPELQAP